MGMGDEGVRGEMRDSGLDGTAQSGTHTMLLSSLCRRHCHHPLHPSHAPRSARRLGDLLPDTLHYRLGSALGAPSAYPMIRGMQLVQNSSTHPRPN
jgi:hypothetical protein